MWTIGAEKRLKASVQLPSDDHSVAHAIQLSLFSLDRRDVIRIGDQLLEKPQSLIGLPLEDPLILAASYDRV